MTFVAESFSASELNRAQAVALGATALVAPTLKENFGASDFSTKTNERDWVTEWDSWAEEQIKKELGKFSSEVGFIGEESGADAAGDVYWTVDPIDGTSHFVRGNELCTTMIALIDKGVPVTSIIFNFMRNTSYTAVAGQGAYEDLTKRMQVSSRPIQSAYLEVYSGQDSEIDKALIESIQAAGAFLLSNASTGHTLASVARGGTEGFVSLPSNPYGTVWDFAPGALLIHEAGGVVRNIGSDDYDVDNFNLIASNRPTFEVLDRLVGKSQTQ